MIRPALGLCCLLALPAQAAWADHFAFDLEVKAKESAKKAQADIAGLGVKPKPRLKLEVKAGEPITAKWTLTYTAAKGKAKNVVVHFFVVKEEQAGQATIPKLDKDVTVETALAMDFGPKEKNQGDLTFTLDKPGVYLLRVETIGAGAGLEGHEHFSSLDVVVRPAEAKP